MLVVRPLGGLSNRLRTIESAYKLSQRINVELEIIWDIDNHSLHASFESLFFPLSGIHIKENYLDSKSTKIIYLIKRFFLKLNSTFISQPFLYQTVDEKWDETRLKLFFENLPKNKKIFVESCWDFYPITRTYSIFKPVSDIQQLIDSYVATNFTSNTIGIHIRRTDHFIAIEASPLELFVQRMREILQKQPDTTFFLATDDKKVQNLLFEIFQEKILCYSKTKSRVLDIGVQEAVIDFFLLSRTNKILGSFWSTFSVGAAEMGSIELEVVAKKIR